MLQERRPLSQDRDKERRAPQDPRAQHVRGQLVRDRHHQGGLSRPDRELIFTPWSALEFLGGCLGVPSGGFGPGWKISVARSVSPHFALAGGQPSSAGGVRWH